MESVAGYPWNGRPDHRGMGGRMLMESMAESAWNTQMKGVGNLSCEVSSEELKWLLEGVDIWSSRPHKSLKYMANT